MNNFQTIKLSLLSALLFISAGISAQYSGNNPELFANKITVEKCRPHLEVLTSPEQEGRETGKPGNVAAANYIASHFEKIGLPGIGDNNSWFQRMDYASESWSEIALSARGKNYNHGKDYYALPAYNSDAENIQGKQLVFLGYGIDDPAYSDYKGQNVKGKILLILDAEPLDAEGKSYLTGSESLSDWSTDWQKKIETATKKGAKAVIIIHPRFAEQFPKIRRQFNAVTYGAPPANKAWINHCFVSPDMALEMAGIKWEQVNSAKEKILNSGKAVPAIKIKCPIELTMLKQIYSVNSNNVLGYIEGTDPLLKDEVVIVSAHYDHLGKKGELIYHGADDNASGTSGVMEIASAFAEAKKSGTGPRRSVLCLLVTGEEKGLWGSMYYTLNPVFPLENTVADVNIDMIGRVDDKHAADPDYIYVIGSDRLSTALHKINEAANASYTRLKLDYTYNAKDDPNRYYFRSDHYNFAKNGIPVIFYFNGTHADYHKPTDTIEKINMDALVKRTRLAFYTAWELANRDERIEVDVKE